MSIELTNDFHNTVTRIANVWTGKVWTRAYVKRVKRRLCAQTECTCSDDFGRRGSQPNGGFEYGCNSDGFYCASLPKPESFFVRRMPNDQGRVCR